MARSALVQTHGSGGAASMPMPAHHAVYLIKQPEEASVKGVLRLLWNVLYRQCWLCMLLLDGVPVTYFKGSKDE